MSKLNKLSKSCHFTNKAHTKLNYKRTKKHWNIKSSDNIQILQILELTKLRNKLTRQSSIPQITDIRTK